MMPSITLTDSPIMTTITPTTETPTAMATITIPPLYVSKGKLSDAEENKQEDPETIRQSIPEPAQALVVSFDNCPKGPEPRHPIRVIFTNNVMLKGYMHTDDLQTAFDSCKDGVPLLVALAEAP